MTLTIWKKVQALWKYRAYEPQPVTWRTLHKWLSQFPANDRPLALDLLNRVIFISYEQTKELLIKRNLAILRKLRRDGVKKDSIIYVQIDDAGSSSAVMLNILKEAARLERSNCKFIDAGNSIALNTVTNELEEGAIIYVDDFIGTSQQFFKSRNFTSQYIVGNFPEFMLSVCICQEALSELERHGIQPFPGLIHAMADRPLHELAAVFEPGLRQRLIALGSRTNKKGGLGHANLATMVVPYRNAPNSLPRLLRGDRDQRPYVGILPRIQDLPVKKV